MLTPPSFWSLYWPPFYQAWGRFQWVRHERRQETDENENQLKERKKQPHPSLTCLLSQVLSMVRAPVSDCGVDFHLPAPPSGSPWAPPTLSLSAYRRRPASAVLGLFYLSSFFASSVIIVCSLKSFSLFSFLLSFCNCQLIFQCVTLLQKGSFFSFLLFCFFRGSVKNYLADFVR